MKHIKQFYALIALSICPQPANAAVECISSASTQITSANNHCENHCGDWADKVPAQKMTLVMPDQFKQMNAFFRNPKIQCSGTCGWGSFPVPGVTAPSQIDYSFRHWSRPALVTLSADICVYEASVPAPPVPVPPTPPTETPQQDLSAPPVPAAPPPPPPPPLPPQKMHVIEEAGPMTPNDCARMSGNWSVDAVNYCRPYKANPPSPALSCKSRADNLFRSVSGTITCSK